MDTTQVISYAHAFFADVWDAGLLAVLPTVGLLRTSILATRRTLSLLAMVGRWRVHIGLAAGALLIVGNPRVRSYVKWARDVAMDSLGLTFKPEGGPDGGAGRAGRLRGGRGRIGRQVARYGAPTRHYLMSFAACTSKTPVVDAVDSRVLMCEVVRGDRRLPVSLGHDSQVTNFVGACVGVYHRCLVDGKYGALQRLQACRAEAVDGPLSGVTMLALRGAVTQVFLAAKEEQSFVDTVSSALDLDAWTYDTKEWEDSIVDVVVGALVVPSLSEIADARAVQEVLPGRLMALNSRVSTWSRVWSWWFGWTFDVDHITGRSAVPYTTSWVSWTPKVRSQ